MSLPTYVRRQDLVLCSTECAAQRDGWMDDVPLADLRQHVGAGPDEVVEVCVADDFREVPAKRRSRVC